MSSLGAFGGFVVGKAVGGLESHFLLVFFMVGVGLEFWLGLLKEAHCKTDNEAILG